MKKDNLSVCLLNDSFPPSIDGVANATKNYADIIQKNHGSSIVVTPQYPGVTDDYPYPVIRYPSLPTQKLIGFRTGVPIHDNMMMSAIKAEPDIYHSHCPFTSTIIARALQRERNSPIVFTYHTKFDIDIQKLIKNKVLQDVAINFIVDNINACDEVWVVSKGAGENLKSLGYKKDYIIMENGVDFPIGKADALDIQKVSLQYGINKNKIKFMFAGRMMWYKGIDLILDSLQRLSALGYDFQMVFIGSGLDMKEITAKTQQYGLEKKCIFTGSITDRKVLRALFSACDLLLFPSTFDTNGIVVREAAACEIPSVLISNSCAAENIVDMETGFIIDKTVESMVAKLELLIKNPNIIKKVGKNAQERIYISWEDAVAVANNRYHTIIDNYSPKTFNNTDQFTDKLYNIATNIYEIKNLFRNNQNLL